MHLFECFNFAKNKNKVKPGVTELSFRATLLNLTLLRFGFAKFSICSGHVNDREKRAGAVVGRA